MESRDRGLTAARVLAVRDLRLTRGSRLILAGVSFEVHRGDVVALMGLSGAGKTSVLRVIAGLERDFQGGVDFADDGPPPRRAAERRHVHHAGMVFQFHHLFEHLSVLDNVCLAPVHVRGVNRQDAEARAQELLADLGVAHRVHALPRELSGGEAQRTAIARALAMEPPVLLLDEPTAALDPARRGSLGGTLGDLARRGCAILLTSHDVDFVRDHASEVLVLAEGQIVERGDPRSVLGQPTHPATRALLQDTSAVDDGSRSSIDLRRR
jgi:ABC-type polar amino acid transport system ATPase subunit